jgi:hypothetical protein
VRTLRYSKGVAPNFCAVATGPSRGARRIDLIYRPNIFGALTSKFLSIPGDNLHASVECDQFLDLGPYPPLRISIPFDGS